MRLCFLTPALPRDDRLGELIRRLAQSHEVTVGLTAERPAGGAAPRVGDAVAVPVADVAGERWDVAIACSWESTAHLFGVSAARHAYLVDHFAHRRLDGWRAERVAAAISYDLPADLLAWGAWVARELRELRPETRVVEVPIAVEMGGSALLRPVEGHKRDHPLRVLVDERHTDAEPTAPVLAEATAPATTTYLLAEDGPAERAAKYANADVLLYLGAHDGILDAPLEAAAHGVPTIATPAGGDDDLIRHLESGIVADPDDARGTARYLDGLAADPGERERLSDGARAAAAAFPAPDAAAAAFAEALEGLLAEEPPEDGRWPERLMGDAMAAVAVLRADQLTTHAELRKAWEAPGYKAGQAVVRATHSSAISPIRYLLRPFKYRLRAWRRGLR
jgi:hypothetical protein